MYLMLAVACGITNAPSLRGNLSAFYVSSGRLPRVDQLGERRTMEMLSRMFVTSSLACRSGQLRPPACAKRLAAALLLLWFVSLVMAMPAAAQNTILDGSVTPVTVLGTYTVPLGFQTLTLGTINNQGNILVNSGGGLNAYLTLQADTTLQGGGAVTLANSGGGGTSFIDGTHVLTNVDNTIQGAGVIGDGTFGFPTLINQAAGTINANGFQPLTINGVFTSNQGLMEATGSGTLNFTNGIIANQGGTIAANGGGEVRLNLSTITGGAITADGGSMSISNATITGATITTLNGGEMGLSSSTIQGGVLDIGSGFLNAGNNTLDGSTGAGAVTIQGTLTSIFGNTLLGVINNQGNILAGSGAGTSNFLTLGGDTVLQGGGTVTLANSGGGGTSFIDGTHVLTNVDNTIQGAGVIGDGTFGFPTLINQAAGTINANVAGQLLNINGVFTSNEGLMEATGGGELLLFNSRVANEGGTILANGGSVILNATPLTNDGGTVQVNAGSLLQVLAPFTQTGGKTQADGTMLAAFGENVSGGSVLGTGTINGGVTMTGGTMQPGDAPGTLTINGDFSASGAMFDELIDTSGNGLLAVNGTATLGPDSLLNIDLLSGFTPFVGETFTLMDFLSGTGVFANAPASGFQMDGFNWTIAYNANDIVLEAGSPVTGGGGGGGGTTATPEPSSLILLGTGLAAVLVCSLSRKRAALRSIRWTYGNFSELCHPSFSRIFRELRGDLTKSIPLSLAQ